MELAFLLLWGMLMTGLGNGACPDPPNIQFVEIIIDRIVMGSKVRYICETGYRRLLGQTMLFTCVNDTGLIHWNIPTTSLCEADDGGTSRLSERKPQSRAVGNPVTIVSSDTTAGYCGMPRTVEYASPRMEKYGVGQELNYTCLGGYDAQTPTSAISVCKKDGGRHFWTELSLECTNDSKSREETTQPVPVGDTSKPSHISPVNLSVTGIVIAPVLMIIFIILGWLLLQKFWARMRSTSEVKLEKTNPVLTVATAGMEKEHEEEAQELKSNV